MTRKRIVLILDLLLLIVLILIDQVTKYLAIARLRGKAPYVLIDGVLELTYVENHGAAFGILQNAGILFVVIAFVMLFAIVFALLRTPDRKRYSLFHLILTVLCAGACGNLIDRLNSAYVVDFIYVSLINFPVFNVADIYVTCSAFALFLSMFTVYKDEEFAFLKLRPQKKQDSALRETQPSRGDFPVENSCENAEDGRE